MINSAFLFGSILAAMACLCSVAGNGGNASYTAPDNQVNITFVSESNATLLSNEIAETKESIAEYDECPIDIGKRLQPMRILNSTNVLCEAQWIVVEYRKEGVLDFNQTWSVYQKGFGTLDGEFFIGLDNLHLLTNSRPHELLLEVQTRDGNSYYGLYGNFLIGNASEDYILKSLGHYSGKSNFFSYDSVGQKFSTIDRDNTELQENCAYQLAAWWHSFRCTKGPHESTSIGSYGTVPVQSIKLLLRPKY